MPHRARHILTVAMPWQVYVLRNEKGRRYVGSTGRSAQQRLSEHNAGLNFWTRANGLCCFPTRRSSDLKQAALRRERYFKTGAGRRTLDVLVGRAGVDQGKAQSGEGQPADGEAESVGACRTERAIF